MNEHLIEMFLLEQLDAFARNGTLSRAADELLITQPALSRNMKKLEGLLGVALFTRENGRISLNATGEVTAKYARQALEANRKVTEMTLAFERSRRTIYLGSAGIPPIGMIVPLIQERFVGKTVTAELADNDQLSSGLHDGTYDLAVFHGRPTERSLFCRPLIEERLCLSVPEDSPLSRRKGMRFDDLEGTRVIAAAGTGFWLQVCKRHVRPESLVILQDFTALEDLLESSSLPSFVSSLETEVRNDNPHRITLPILDDDARTLYHLACREDAVTTYERLFRALGSR